MTAFPKTVTPDALFAMAAEHSGLQLVEPQSPFLSPWSGFVRVTQVVCGRRNTPRPERPLGCEDAPLGQRAGS